MLKKTKIWLAIIIIFVTAVFVIVIGVRDGIPDNGLASVTNSDDLKKLKIQPDYAWGINEGDEKMFQEVEEECQQYVADLEASSVIINGSATGNINQSSGSIGQEVTVLEVIQGNNMISEGDKVWVYQYFGFYAENDKIRYVEPLNIMKKGDSYLIFLDEAEWEPQFKTKSYIAKDCYLPYVNLENETIKTLTKGIESYDFSDLEDYEVFSVSEKITDVLNRMKSMILYQYSGE